MWQEMESSNCFQSLFINPEIRWSQETSSGKSSGVGGEGGRITAGFSGPDLVISSNLKARAVRHALLLAAT
jgi:hypothetical protein